MKRAFLLILLLFVTACSSGSEETVTCKEQFWDGEIAICLPDAWDVLEREKLAEKGVPQTVILALQSEKVVSGQYPTVTVTKETLTQPIDSVTYSAASIQSVAAIPGYQQIDKRTLKKMDGEEVDLHIFSAQPLPEEPGRRFYQFSVTLNNNGYTFTALTPLSVPGATEAEVLLMLRSAGLKQPVAVPEE